MAYYTGKLRYDGDGFARTRVEGEDYIYHKDGSKYQLITSIREANENTEAIELKGRLSNDWQEDVLKLKSLKVLLVNSLHVKSIPEDIGNISLLRKIQFYHCMLRNVPTSIGQLQNLEYLDLSFNLIHEIPKEIRNCNQLKKLRVASNSLKELPQSFSHLQNLEFLDVIMNRFQEIPEVIWSIPKLQEVYFGMNIIDQFSIPNHLMKIIASSKIKLLNLQDNHISQNTINQLKWILPDLKVYI